MFLYADTGDSAQADLTCDPAHDEIYNKFYATSEDSVQTAHPPSKASRLSKGGHNIPLVILGGWTGSSESLLVTQVLL